jgi:hypothetical protein
VATGMFLVCVTRTKRRECSVDDIQASEGEHAVPFPSAPYTDPRSLLLSRGSKMKRISRFAAISSHGPQEAASAKCRVTSLSAPLRNENI